jgi:arabinan endo-1,5-alpha-L-arabinosidase
MRSSCTAACWLVLLALAAPGCAGDAGPLAPDQGGGGDLAWSRDRGSTDGPVVDGAALPDSAPTDAPTVLDTAFNPDAKPKPDTTPPPPCTTRITYGSSWLKPASHATYYDDVKGKVTWSGSCSVDSTGNAYATLSNGWKPYFKGRNCVMALDYNGACSGMPSTCGTRISYGPSWLKPSGHPASYDDVSGALTWDGICHASGSQSWAQLSNGWKPYFSGSKGCDLAFRHIACGGLFNNSVVGSDCPDPGVLKDGSTYYMVCTPGPGYPIRSSKDLVHWTYKGKVFLAATKPAWASTHFWAPELHKVGAKYIVYFSAKRSINGVFAIGAAWSTSPTGPFTDIGKPLVTEPAPGAIDAHYVRDASGKHYITWKVDGNAVGKPTPIKIRPLAADGLSVTGTAKTILSNTLSWEGALVEGQWMIKQGSYYYLFYSGNGYASTSYGVGVARATSPLGPFTKGAKILGSKGAWAGPGHGSVVKGPSGAWVHVYHAWVAGKVGQSPGRLVLVDRLQWSGGWPLMRTAPSSRSQPLP